MTTNYYKLFYSKHAKLMKRFSNGVTYKTVADEMGVAVSTLYRWGKVYGKAPGWKRELNNDRMDKIKSRVLKQVCVIPNLRKVCELEGVNYGTLTGPKHHIRIRPLRCVKLVKNKCKVCGKSIGNRYWTERVCYPHRLMGKRQRNKIKKLTNCIEKFT